MVSIVISAYYCNLGSLKEEEDDDINANKIEFEDSKKISIYASPLSFISLLAMVCWCWNPNAGGHGTFHVHGVWIKDMTWFGPNSSLR